VALKSNVKGQNIYIRLVQLALIYVTLLYTGSYQHGNDLVKKSSPSMEPKFHYHDHKSPPLGSVSSQMKKVVHISISYYFQINFNLILPSTPIPPK
jgi:hypothetical protein